ncbi:MAG: hypothetical protein QM763_04375 [Agriterribacter sp.]
MPVYPSDIRAYGFLLKAPYKEQHPYIVLLCAGIIQAVLPV